MVPREWIEIASSLYFSFSALLKSDIKIFNSVLSENKMPLCVESFPKWLDSRNDIFDLYVFMELHILHRW